MQDYFPYGIRFHNKEFLVIWFDGGDEEDGLYRVSQDRIAIFTNMDSLHEFLATRGLGVESTEYNVLDLDAVAAWLADSDGAVDCGLLLDAWNFFRDLARSLDRVLKVDDVTASPIYEKLFWGSNLPAVTPPGERFVPRWLARELEILRRILRSGIKLWISTLGVQS